MCVCGGEVSAAREPTVWSGGRLQVRTKHTSNNMLHICPSVFLKNAYTFLYSSSISVYKGRNVETVEVAADSEFYTLSNLQPDTEYIVTIIPLYEGNTEGPGATARFKIGRCGFSSSLHETSLSEYF